MNPFKSSINISKGQVVLLVKKKKKSSCQERWVQSLSWEDRPLGVGNGNLLQYSYLENSMGRSDCKATVPRTAESDTTQQLSTCACMHTHTHKIYDKLINIFVY